MKKLLHLTLIILTCTQISCEKNQENGTKKSILTTNPKTSTLDKLVDSIVSPYIAKSTSAGLSLAVINGSSVSTYHYGETKLGNRVLPNNSTRYEIGSITKTFTAIALHHWITAVKRQTLDAPAAAFLPNTIAPKLITNGVPVTLKHLLNHTSGLPRIPNDLPNNNDPYAAYDSLKTFQYISNNSLIRTPGTSPQTDADATLYYSNLAYGLAGIILERNYQRPLQDVLQLTLLNDLNMSHTSINNLTNWSNNAFPHNSNNTAKPWHFSGMAGAGGLKSTLANMITFAQANLQATPNSSLGICQTPTVQLNGRDLFGLGWEFYYTSSNKRITVKDGGTGGFSAFIAFDRAQQKALIALFNNQSDNHPATPFVQLLERFF